ncbi:MAG: quinolinate synthase NadA [Thermoproteota archaeon]|nr:quinolinate synthase NadA [Thermoproteota archaeon]
MKLAEVGFAEEIESLKREMNAIVLAHNYQLAEVQEVADFVGDSLALSRQAAQTNADVIVFCGVHFMAETASILCPNKMVLIPDPKAGCSLASTINADELRAWKKEHPEAVIVSYVNTTAEVKALSDYCCTSSNAVNVVNSIPKEHEILFLPDFFLGSYVAKMTGRRNMFIWPGECHVHAGIKAEDINDKLQKFTSAEFLIHPECGCTSSTLYHVSTGEIDVNVHVLSTDGMMRHVRESNASQFVVATETGILHRMKSENPDKAFIPVKEDAVCKYMKMITLEKVMNSLVKKQYEVKVQDQIAEGARKSIMRMMQVS